MVLSTLKQAARGLYKLPQARRIQRPTLDTRDLGSRHTVVFAGHDFRFIDAFMKHLQEGDTSVIVDEWLDHTWHGDLGYRKKIIDVADVIWCEWGLGNAVWYTKHKRPGQRLIVRVHAQELRTDHLGRIDLTKVDQFIFVAEHIRQAAMQSFNLPAERCVVIPNYVDTDKFDLPKHEGAEFNIGFVGFTPRSKRLDLALEVIKELRAVDTRFGLHIKGKLPKEYPWLMRDKEQRAYYEEIFDELAFDADLNGAVAWHPHGHDLPEFYRSIGHVISTSDHEAFHYTVAEGAASGAQPHVLSWVGADQLYPREWLAAQHSEIVANIRSRNTQGVDNSKKEGGRVEKMSSMADFIKDTYGCDRVFKLLEDILVVGNYEKSTNT